MKIILLIILIVLSCHADSHFFDLFYKGDLGARHCGDNAQKLIQTWYENDVDLSNTEIWHIVSKAPGNFGMLKGYQNRWGRYKKFPYSGDADYAISEAGWYHHVFVVKDGQVYDLSYKKEATIVSIKDYVLDMFVLKTDVGKYYFEKVDFGLKSIKGYQIQALHAYDYIKLYLKGEVVVNQLGIAGASNCGVLNDFVEDESFKACF